MNSKLQSTLLGIANAIRLNLTDSVYDEVNINLAVETKTPSSSSNGPILLAMKSTADGLSHSVNIKAQNGLIQICGQEISNGVAALHVQVHAASGTKLSLLTIPKSGGVEELRDFRLELDQCVTSLQTIKNAITEYVKVNHPLVLSAPTKAKL